MIGYLDTSAFIPLIVAEPSSVECRRFWDDADAVISTRLLYVEAAAAIAQAQRMNRLSAKAHRASLGQLDHLWEQLEVIDVDQPIVERAARLSYQLELRGYDAVHCASAEALSGSDTVAAAGDQRLLTALRQLGIATFDTNQASNL